MRRLGLIVMLPAIVLSGTVRMPDTAGAARHVGAISEGMSASSRINVFLRSLAKKRLFMGSVLIARKDTVLMDKGYGMADWEHHKRNTPQTKFRLASITKQFTAMAIMQLQEQGKLRVQDRACSYIDRCPALWKDVTIHQLLSHTAGIVSLDGEDGNHDGVTFDDSKYWSAAQIIDLVKNMPLLFKPGTDWHYTNIGYIGLGLIVEKVSGEQYGVYLKNHIFGPLGMTDTGVAQDGVNVRNLALGYDDQVRVDASLFNTATASAARGIYSTVGDLYLWDQALTTEKLVTKKSLDAMFAPAFTFPDQSGYGYGWGIGSFAHHRVLSHGGGMPGVATWNALFPDDQLIVIILTNNGRTAMNGIVAFVLKAVFKMKGPSKRHLLAAA